MLLNSIVVENEEVAALLTNRGDEAGPRDETEATRFEWLAARVFALYESVYADVSAGLLDPALADAYMQYYGDLVGNPVFRSFWESHRNWYYDEFAEHVDRQVTA